MTTDTQPPRAVVTHPARDAVRRFTRRGAHHDTKLLLALVLVPVGIVIAVAAAPDTMPITSLMVPLLLGSLLLAPRRLPLFVCCVLAALAVSLVLQEQVSTKTWGAIGIQVLMCLIVLGFSVRRSRLGVAGATGESMFVDLRDQILAQGRIPTLPDGWAVDRALLSAGGTPFAGDFLVVTRPVPERLEIAVVDVSGKGEEAGTRGLLLSGVFGGLLGALPPEQFLGAANDFLLRQDWDEGFATAVHLSLTLADGSYVVRSAGHPPAASRSAATGEWALLGSSGPVLGLVADAEFVPATGRLDGPGDALLLYTDGMVETARRDLDEGIALLLREADPLVAAGASGAASRLVEALGSRDDDRALVVVSRGGGRGR